MTVRIRDFAPSDYESFAELGNLAFPGEERSAEERRADDRILEDGPYAPRRYVLEIPETNGPVAVGEYSRGVASADPRSYWLSLTVHPRYRRRGYGGVLHERLLSEVRGLGGHRVRASVLEDTSEGAAFLRRRGYVECRRLWHSEADPSVLDLAGYAPLFDTLEKKGIELESFAGAVAQRPDAWDALYRLDAETGVDSPHLDPFEPVARGVWDRLTRENPDFVAEGSFVAKDGDRYVGTSYATRIPGTVARWHHEYTGVVREYRGQGIATALKVRLLEYARSHGVRSVRTYNDARNAPMLAINARLGFRRRDTWVTFQRDL